jgi:ribosomal protein S18 acetylase RimI-like enzyme
MNKYRVREAYPQDIESVYAIFSLTDILHHQAHPDFFQETDDPKDIKDYLLAGIQDDDTVVFVAEEGGLIIGAIIASVRHTAKISILVDRTFVSVENLVVTDKFRQRGVGQTLMEQVHLWTKARGLKEIELTVWEFNQGAIAFYENLGYQTLHHRMRKVLP